MVLNFLSYCWDAIAGETPEIGDLTDEEQDLLEDIRDALSDPPNAANCGDLVYVERCEAFGAVIGCDGGYNLLDPTDGSEYRGWAYLVELLEVNQEGIPCGAVLKLQPQDFQVINRV